MAFNWAYIGCGGIAVKTAKEVLKNGDKIVACWNRSPARAEKFAKQFGAKCYPTPQEAITAEGVQGVYVAVTANMHKYYVDMCVNLGVPVLCEKPFAVNTAETESALANAKDKHVYVSEAMWTWHNKIAHKVKSWVDDGKIGKVTSVKASFAVPMLQITGAKRLIDPALMGGALVDIGIYPVRYVYELFGMPTGVTATGTLRNGVDTTEKVTMHYPEFDADITVSITKLIGESLTIKGTEGKITVPIYHKARVAKLRGKCRETVRDNSLLYGTQFANVANEITQHLDESPLVPHQSTIDTMKLLDECRRQLGVKYPME